MNDNFHNFSNSSFSDLPTCNVIGLRKERRNVTSKVSQFYAGKGEFPLHRTKYMTHKDFNIIAIPDNSYCVMTTHIKEETKLYEKQRQINIGYAWSALHHANINNVRTLRKKKEEFSKKVHKRDCTCGIIDTKTNNVKKLEMFRKGIVQSLNDRIDSIIITNKSVWR